MANLSRRAKFLSIIAALGSVGGVANAGNNNENRNKNEIRRQNSTAKELLKDTGLLAFGIIGGAATLSTWQKIKQQKLEDQIIDYSKKNFVDINKLFIRTPNGYMSDILNAYGENSGCNYNTMNMQRIHLDTSSDLKMMNFKEDKGKVSVNFKDAPLLLDNGCSQKIENAINGNRVLKEIVLNSLRMEEKFMKSMENSDNCPCKFVIKKSKNARLPAIIELGPTDEMNFYGLIKKNNNILKKQKIFLENMSYDDMKGKFSCYGKLELKFETENNQTVCHLYGYNGDSSGETLLTIDFENNLLLKKFSHIKNHAFEITFEESEIPIISSTLDSKNKDEFSLFDENIPC